MKNAILAAMLAGGASFALAGCGETAEAPAAVEESSDLIEGIEVSDARLLLPPVTGNPAAIYLKIANNGDQNIAFRSAEVEIAGRAEIHDSMEMDGTMVMGQAPPVMIETGGEATFEPGGLHVMVFDLAEDFGVGDTTKVTLIAAGNRRHTFEVTAMAAGDDR